MQEHADLHSHSTFAGGAQGGGKTPLEKEKRMKKRFEESAIFSPLKGVNLLGTGDIQFKKGRGDNKTTSNKQGNFWKFNKW